MHIFAGGWHSLNLQISDTAAHSHCAVLPGPVSPFTRLGPALCNSLVSLDSRLSAAMAPLCVHFAWGACFARLFLTWLPCNLLNGRPSAIGAQHWFPLAVSRSLGGAPSMHDWVRPWLRGPLALGAHIRPKCCYRVFGPYW